VARIFALKGRPADHPLIVHFADPAAIDAWAIDIPQAARMLAARFWPGPLTMILGKSPRVPGAVTGGQDTSACVARRIRSRRNCCANSPASAAVPSPRRRRTSSGT
jgi:tRNA A37 threonylcarbamoyladenosine synthetase subunit TsaC/SUA5/YrdC